MTETILHANGRSSGAIASQGNNLPQWMTTPHGLRFRALKVPLAFPRIELLIDLNAFSTVQMELLTFFFHY